MTLWGPYLGFLADPAQTLAVEAEYLFLKAREASPSCCHDRGKRKGESWIAGVVLPMAVVVGKLGVPEMYCRPETEVPCRRGVDYVSDKDGPLEGRPAKMPSKLRSIGGGPDEQCHHRRSR